MARLLHWRALVLLTVVLGFLLVAGRPVAPRLTRAQAADPAELAAQAGPLTAVPPSALPTNPSLALTWPDGPSYVGVPITLAVQARTPDGQPDATRAGAVQLLVDDPRAIVTTTGPNSTTLTGSPVTLAQRFTTTLSGGAAQVAVNFSLPGRHTVLAQTAGDSPVAGESPALQVQPVVLTLQAAGGLTQASKGRVSIVAQDERGRPVPGYARAITLVTDDPDATVGEAGAPDAQAKPGGLAHTFTPGDAGHANLDVKFARAGARRIEVRDALDHTPLATLPVSVAAAPGGPPMPTGPSAATATAAATPGPGASPTAQPATPAAVATVPAATPSPAPGTTRGDTTPDTAAAPRAVPGDAPAEEPAATAPSDRLAAPRPELHLVSAQSAPRFSISTSSSTATTGIALQMTVQALDATGVLNTSYTGTVQFTSTDAGFAPGTAFRYTFTAGRGDTDNGVHTFSVTFNTLGSQTITVTDTTTPSMTGTSPTVTVSGIPYFTVTPSSSTATAGTALTMTVRAYDAAGALNTGYTGTVQLSSSDAAFLPGVNYRYTFVLADAGVHTFSVTFNATGSQRLAVQDTTNPAVTGQSTAITVGAASGAYFSVSPSTFSPTAGTALTMTVTARNPNGTTNTTYGGTVQFTSTDPAFAPGTSYRYTFLPDPRGESGVHAFSVTFATTGSQTLTVTDTTNTAMTGTSAAVTVGAAGGTGYSFAWSSSSTNAGVPDTLTVSYPLAGRGYPTIQFTSPDAGFSPGPAYRYTFTAADAGSHAFAITFATAGTQSITVTDGTYTSTSPTVSVAETVFTATFGASQVTQGVSVNLTVQAKTTGGTVLTGYRGTVRLSASYQSVLASAWGTGVDPVTAGYTFTATDSGSHVFTPAFSYAGDQTATVTDAALASRTVTSGPISVTNAPAASYSHEAAPSGASLADGSVVWAYLGVRGRLWTRRQVGASLSEPAWRPAVMARDVTTGQVGADSPSIVRLGSTLALFHSYPDAGGILQVWLTTSTDSGLTWGSPTQLTTESGHVGRVQAVVSGATVSLFFSRQDTSGKLYYETSTTLTSWSSKTLAGQSVGPLAANTTSNFGIVKLASGSWLLGWLGTPLAGEPPLAPTGSLTYPTVQVATSTDLATWSSATELTQPYTQRWPTSVGLMQEAGGTIRALVEQYTVPKDSYLLQRTSTNGTSWTAPATVGSDRAAAADGTQGYVGQLPTFAAGTTQCAWSLGASGGTLESYGTMDWNYADSLRAVALTDCASPVETLPLPPGDDPRTVAGSGASGTDLAVAARMMVLTVGRTYVSYAALAGQSGPFGVGWTWSYGTRAVTHLDGSVTIIEASGRRLNFWKTGSTWTAGPGINATLAAAGGGYTLTTHSQSVLAFDSSGKLTSVADRNGNTLTITYAGSAPTTITAAGGRALTITTNAQGRITAINGPAALSSSYTYDASGQLLTATDASGAVTTYTYDSRHQLLTVRDGRGITVTTNTYGSLGRVTRQDLGYWTDGRGGSGYLSTVSYAPAAQGTSGSWSPSIMTNGRGTQTRTTTDAGLRPLQTEVWDMEVRTGHPVPTLEQRTLATYTANGDILTTTNALGRVTTNTYDSRANVLTTTLDSGTGGLNLTTTNTYNATNDLLTTTDPLGHTTTYAYDSHGNLLTITDPLSHSMTSTYDSYGQRLTTTDATGRVSAFTYTTAGDLASTTAASGTAEATTTTYASDAAGRRTSTTDVLGHTSSTSYDGMGRPLTMTNALGKTWSTQYDAVGNRIQVTDPLNHATTWGYDALSRLTTVTEPGGGTTSYTYDANGNKIQTTNALGSSTSATFDALNRVTSETDALGRTTTYAYDAAGNGISVGKPSVGTITYTYDRVNRLTSIAAPGTPTISYTYDVAGRRASMTDGTGTTTYTYDAASRVTSFTAPTTGTVSYAYDTAGRRTALTYPSTHQVTYTYTQRGQLASVTDWLGGVTAYTYDAAGRWTGASIPNSVAETLTYDNANQLLCISHGPYTDTLRGGGTVTEGICYTYDAVGNRLTRSDSFTSRLPTTSAAALKRVAADDVPDELADRANVAALARLAAESIHIDTYSYDELCRLTADNGTSYTYDGEGNRLTETTGAATTIYEYDGAAELITKTPPAGAGSPATYTYDGEGRQTSVTRSAPGGEGDIITTYTYDAHDNLTAVSESIAASPRDGAVGDELEGLTGAALHRTSAGRTATRNARLLTVNGETYTYNGHGLRVSKTVGSTTTRYTWDLGGSSQLLAESDGTTTTEYVYGKALIAEITGTSATYHHADGLGTSVVTTNGSGQSVGARGYDAFGRIVSNQGATSSLGYTGEQQNSSTGLVYLRARWYDPDTGRFLTKDPFGGWSGKPSSQHPYVYAGNNPVGWTDPSGQLEKPTVQSLLDSGACSAEGGDCGDALLRSTLDWAVQEAERLQTVLAYLGVRFLKEETPFGVGVHTAIITVAAQSTKGSLAGPIPPIMKHQGNPENDSYPWGKLVTKSTPETADTLKGYKLTYIGQGPDLRTQIELAQMFMSGRVDYDPTALRSSNSNTITYTTLQLVSARTRYFAWPLWTDDDIAKMANDLRGARGGVAVVLGWNFDPDVCSCPNLAPNTSPPPGPQLWPYPHE